MSKRPARPSAADGQIVALIKGNDLPFTVLRSDGITVDSLHRSLDSALLSAFRLLNASCTNTALVRSPNGDTHTLTLTVKERFNFFPAERQAV